MPHRREGGADGGRRDWNAAEVRHAVDGSLDRIRIRLQVARELIDRILRLLAGLSVRLAEILEVGLHVSVADFMSSPALFIESREKSPLLSEPALDLIELVQV